MGRNLQIKNSSIGSSGSQEGLSSILDGKKIAEEIKEGLFIGHKNLVLFANKAFYSMHGFNSRYASENKVLDFVAPESRNEFAKKLREMIDGKSQIQMEYYRLHRDGRKIPTELRSNTISLYHGQAFVGISLDLLDRKRSEEEMRQLKEFNENILSSSFDAIIVADLNGSIIYFNPAVERIVHHKKEEVIGRPISSFYKDKELLREKLDLMEKTNGPVSYEAVILDREGGEHVMFITRSPLRDSNGNLIGSVGVSKDITERKLMEEEVRVRERLACIGQLTALLAHEIRNPLSSIKINIQILSKKLNLFGNDRRRMEIIDSEIKRLEKIPEDLLNFVKPVKLFFKPENVNKIIEKVLESIGEKIAEKHIVVEKDLDKELPKIPLDKEKMEQVILNIVLNCIDAVELDGKMEIITGMEEITGEKIIKIGIFDNGIGIEDDNMKNIFEPFYTTKLKGTGLGLSIVQKIIKAHRGFFRVDSRVNQGTKFFLFLPEK